LHECEYGRVLCICFSLTGDVKGNPARLSKRDQQKLLTSIWQSQLQQKPQQHSEDEGLQMSEERRENLFQPRSASATLRRSDQQQSRRETKKWNHFDERRNQLDAKDLGGQYNVLDQIGSNIIRRK